MPCLKGLFIKYWWTKLNWIKTLMNQLSNLASWIFTQNVTILQIVILWLKNICCSLLNYLGYIPICFPAVYLSAFFRGIFYLSCKSGMRMPFYSTSLFLHILPPRNDPRVGGDSGTQPKTDASCISHTCWIEPLKCLLETQIISKGKKKTPPTTKNLNNIYHFTWKNFRGEITHTIYKISLSLTYFWSLTQP